MSERGGRTAASPSAHAFVLPTPYDDDDEDADSHEVLIERLLAQSAADLAAPSASHGGLHRDAASASASSGGTNSPQVDDTRGANSGDEDEDDLISSMSKALAAHRSAEASSRGKGKKEDARAVEEEAARLSEEATQALRGVRYSISAGNNSSTRRSMPGSLVHPPDSAAGGIKRNSGHAMLQLEAKERPVLIRASRSQVSSVGASLDQRAGLGLEEDLADALGEVEDIRTLPRTHTGDYGQGGMRAPPQADNRGVAREAHLNQSKTSDHPARPTAEDEDAVPTDLLARFSALRPPDTSARPTATTASAPDSDPYVSDPFAFLGLPSVPDSEPALSQGANTPPGPSHPTLGPAHGDIPAERNLDPFRALVGRDLDVNRLGEVGSARPDHDPYVSILPSPPRSDEDEDDADPSELCSLCTNDASLACFSPVDPMDGCAGDLYCSECWVEGHARMDRDELKEHRTRDVLPRARGGRRGPRRGVSSTRKRAMAA